MEVNRGKTLDVKYLDCLCFVRNECGSAHCRWKLDAESRHANSPVHGGDLSNKDAHHSLQRNPQIFFLDEKGDENGIPTNFYMPLFAYIHSAEC